MKRTFIIAGLALALAFSVTPLAHAGTSPGSQGTGQTAPVQVSPDLQNAKPMPLPSVDPAVTSSPGSTGSGQTNPTTVSPDLRNAKPMPLPSIDAPSTHTINVNKRIAPFMTMKAGDKVVVTTDSTPGSAVIIEVSTYEANGDALFKSGTRPGGDQQYTFSKPGTYLLLVSYSKRISNPYWTQAEVITVTVKR